MKDDLKERVIEAKDIMKECGLGNIEIERKNLLSGLFKSERIKGK